MTAQSSGARPTAQLIAGLFLAGLLAFVVGACASSSSASAPRQGQRRRAPRRSDDASVTGAGGRALGFVDDCSEPPRRPAANRPTLPTAGRPAEAAAVRRRHRRLRHHPRCRRRSTPIVSATAPTPDPRVGLKAGWWDAGAGRVEHAHDLDDAARRERCWARRTRTWRSRASTRFRATTTGSRSTTFPSPTKPVLVQTYLCPASQNDVSVYKNLLFMSSEATNSRSDCGFERRAGPGQQGARARDPRVRHRATSSIRSCVTTVQTCRGSHTHTVVTQPGDNENVYIYVSGTARVRSAEEAAGMRRTAASTIRTRRASGSR